MSKTIRRVDTRKLEIIVDRLDFKAIAEFLTKTKGVFIKDMDRRTVPYARRRLEKLTGKKIVSLAARDGEEKGYVFQFSAKTVNNKKANNSSERK